MRFFIFILTALQINFLEAGVTVKREKNYCKVREPGFSQIFDFSVLSNPDNDYTIKHDTDDALRLQPCSVLKTSCNGQKEYSICLSKNGQEIGIGKNPPKVVVEFGEYIFKYTGDACDKQNNYTVDIKMKCDFKVKEANEGIELYAAGYNECNFKMDWRTFAACTKPKKINCTIDNESGHYDLSELTKLSGNYEVFVNDKKTVLLNVCHSVIYGANTCKSDHGACLIDSESGKSTPIGEPKQNLQYNADGSLSLHYNDGGICNYNVGEAIRNIQTTINFICDLNAIGTLPHYVGGMELCHFQFNWTIAAACSEQALHNKSLEKENSDVCVVKNPITGQIYNFTALMNKEFSVKPFGTNEVYKFMICNAIADTGCKKGTGACKLHKNTSGGIANSNLMWKESGPYLNYTNGELCNYGRKQQRYTIIEFSCGPEDYEIDEDGCYDQIKFSTPFACKKQETCSTNNNQVNLKPLMSQLSNYVIESDDVEYHVNLCQPLVKDYRLSACTNEKASICKITIRDGKVISTTNLGRFDTPLFTSSDQSAVIIYNNGSVCEEDKKRRIESKISFLCDIHSQKTQPKFMYYKNCEYNFEWKTSLVCGTVGGYFNENCSINNTLGDYRNLSLLGKNNDLVTSIAGKNNKLYKISLCGDRKECKGGFVCDDNVNYGTSISVLYDYAESPNTIRLHFTGGSKCNNGSLAQAVLSINCRDDYISNPPVVIKERPCYLEFEWNRTQICHLLNVPENSISKDDTKPNIALNEARSLSGGAITGIIIAILIVVIVIFYLKNESRRMHLVEMISNSTTRNCDRVKYSRVNTMEEVHLLLNESDPTVIDSETDDDELLDA